MIGCAGVLGAIVRPRDLYYIVSCTKHMKGYR